MQTSPPSTSPQSKAGPQQAVKLIPFEKAVWSLRNFCDEQILPNQDLQTLLLWLNSAPTIENGGETYVRLDTLTDIFRNFVKYLESGDPTALVEQRGWKSGKLVDVIEFVESRDYVGSLLNLWPGVKDNLWQIWRDWDPAVRKFEIILTGAIRTGKSMTTQLCLEYCSYLFSQLHNPFAEFDLSPGRKIVIALQSTTQEKAERVIMGPMKADFDASPYFNRYYRRNKDINSIIVFPNDFQVMTVTSKDTSAYGENVFGIAITEANAMDVIKNSVKLRYSNKTEYNQALELYNAARERIVATFPPEHPMYFGKLILDSSVENPEDFTSQLADSLKDDPAVLIIDKTIWDAQPESKFPRDEPKFPVEIGDNHHASRVLEWEVDAETGERVAKDARTDESVLWVPDRLLRFFNADIETALKRFAGKVTAVTGAFLPFKDKINKAQMEHAKFTGRQSLFLTEEMSFLDMFGRREPGEPVDWERLINYRYIDECILDTQVPFSMRVDLSATEDATGFAISRIIGYKMVSEATIWNEQTQQFEQAIDQQLPIYMTDGMLKIFAVQGEEIDPELVAWLGIALAARLNVKWGTGDTAESTRAVLMAWRRHKIYCDFLSVDTDLRAYMEAKSAIREERWLFPPHNTADKEFKGVRKVTKNGKSKIDHPDTATGSKDVADAAVGSIFVLHLKERLYRDQGAQGTKGPRGREGVPTPGDYDQSAQRGMTRRGSIVRSGQGKNRLNRRLRIVA